VELIFFGFILILVGFLLINTLGFLIGAPYAPTPNKNVKQLLKELKLTKKDVVYDLGSGDGRLLIEVSKFKAQAIGFEINPFLYLFTLYRIKQIIRAKVYLKDFWKQDLSNATIIFAFILPQFMSRLEKKLASEVKPGTKVITYLANLPKKPIKSFSGFNIYLF
jgi:16S rRNA A1518/A1519 N6-dimethyltransferase RsmA/KsgA/DIM1 with predicted DNA glycosylase/AP lyase activity